MSNGNDKASTEDVLRAELDRVEKQMNELKLSRNVLRDALKAMGATPVRKRQRSPKPGPVREDLALDFLRKHPTESYEPLTLARAMGDGDMPLGSAYGVVDRLLGAGKVTQVGESDRGKPLIKHKPVTTRPGEGVRAA